MINITPAGYEISLISLGITIVSSLVRRAVVDMDKLTETKKQMKEHQQSLAKLTKAGGDPKKIQEINEKMIALTMENLKHSFRPMLITLIPFIILFRWIRTQYSPIGIVSTVFGFDLGWFGWYFLSSMIFGIALNKIIEKI